MSKRRVVVTGLGIVSPLGSTVATAWDGDRQRAQRHRAHHALRRHRLSRAASAAQSKDFNAEEYMRAEGSAAHGSVRALRRRRRHAGRSGTRASRSPKSNCERIGVVMGAGIGGLATIEENTAKWLEAKTPRKISPFFIPAASST